jgi:hypothetical protein
MHTMLLAAVQVDSRDQAAARSVPGQSSPLAGAARPAKEETGTSGTEILNALD